jgi:hypothetical protein
MQIVIFRQICNRFSSTETMATTPLVEHINNPLLGTQRLLLPSLLCIINLRRHQLSESHIFWHLLLIYKQKNRITRDRV